MPDQEKPASGRPPLVEIAEERYRRYHPEDAEKSASSKSKADRKPAAKHDEKEA